MKMSTAMNFTNSAVLKLFFTLMTMFLQTCSGLQNITVHPGQNITLPCHASSHKPIIAVQWTRPDLTPEYVLFYMGGQPYQKYQHSSFLNRVDLQDRQMKDGNMSLILRNVNTNDTGIYECRVKENDGRRKRRSEIQSQPIDTIMLTVTEPGHIDEQPMDGGNGGGQVGLTVGLSVAGAIVVLLLAVVGFTIFKKYKGRESKSPYQPPPEQGAETQVCLKTLDKTSGDIVDLSGAAVTVTVASSGHDTKDSG